MSDLTQWMKRPESDDLIEFRKQAAMQLDHVRSGINREDYAAAEAELEKFSAAVDGCLLSERDAAVLRHRAQALRDLLKMRRETSAIDSRIASA